jgi:hypothetical protein
MRVHFFAGHLGEVKPLSTVVRSRMDLKVVVGSWRWSASNPWPPIEAVKKAGFWSLPVYEAARTRLRRPAPQIELKGGSDFVTINTLTGAASVTKEADTVPQVRNAALPELGGFRGLGEG